MVYKVYYQEPKQEVPVRERTKSLYMEAESEREARLRLKDKPYNIEFVQKVDGAYYEYESQSEHFKIMENV
ncbi:DNA-dependent RNA polymerase subunit epsilon [Bacillus fonticola]|uniref:DNA-dependent RNA polymerase subunit epsilon n=1 Tax=Bacillus fonticola TaxID=2728853 RepID=UPI001472D2D1|nr:DNA-directed RNA polymerase subunit epsilon [Bacillus fonticola]